MTFGFYALFLKKTVGCTINYGKTKYDYDDETVVCFAPGRTIGVQSIEGGPVPEADALLFHLDFLHRTPLAQKIRQYTFFSYASNEALHLSVDERLIIQDYMGKIAREFEHPTDKFSKPLIISNIEILLNYCMRFYERQFITREELNNDMQRLPVSAAFPALLQERGRLHAQGIPRPERQDCGIVIWAFLPALLAYMQPEATIFHRVWPGCSVSDSLEIRHLLSLICP
ncbi:MAG TPA: hypothetical protein IAC86_07880 [Candidatus Cryptobacteroides excrementigallinarum]|nr:hypothetical protein [Candidatus Cryptobacteroides excrementigallinarum]